MLLWVICMGASRSTGEGGVAVRGSCALYPVLHADLLTVARDEVGRYGVELVEDRVTDARAGFVLTLAGGRELRARQVC
jgi:hypothetical protein